MALAQGNTTYFVVTEDAFTSPVVEIKAIGDVNGDGRTDIVTVQASNDVLARTQLVVALGKADGTFQTNAPVFVGAPPTFIDPRVVIGDFTGDAIPDMAVYDAGYYDWSVRTTIGGEPVLFVGNAHGTLTASDAIKVAAQPFVQAGGPQYDLTMGIKDVAEADIDLDGDLDLWVESTGSHNLAGHFLINNGGVFSIDIENRLSRATYYGSGSGDYWRYGHAEFLDVNGDGAPDLVLEQIRDDHFTHTAQSSFIVLNDGGGNFPGSNAIRLPLPDFYQGYTSAEAVAAWDINRDGRQDLVMVHTRNDDVTGAYAEPAWTGTYVQVMIQQPDGTFADETAARIGSQATWSSKDLEAFNTAKSITQWDLNADGIMDFVLGYDWARPVASKPLLFMGRGDGTFVRGDESWITGGDPYFGEGLRPVDLNGDPWLDFIHLDSHPGANGSYDGFGTDDYMSIVRQLGTGPLGGGGTPAALHVAGTAGNDTLSGGGANDMLDGLGGVDIALFTGARSAHTITAAQDTATITGAGVDTLTGVERAHFADGKIALDLDGNAGDVAKVLGAVFGAASVQDAQYVGIGLAFADQGMDMTALMSLALAARLGAGATDEAVVTLLYANVVGVAPSAADVAYFAGMIGNGFTQTSLGVLAAETEFNAASIGLAGLMESGLAYA